MWRLAQYKRHDPLLCRMVPVTSLIEARTPVQALVSSRRSVLKPGELKERRGDGKLTEEFKCAQYLDALPEVKFWARNL